MQSVYIGGGGGNRTRVRKPSATGSTYLAIQFFLTADLAEWQADRQRVTLDLVSRQVTRRETSHCK